MTDQNPADDSADEPVDAADPRRAILQRVARGEIEPEEAAELLAAIARRDDTSERGGTPPSSPVGTTTSAGRAKRIRVKAALRSVIIEGDPSVSEADPAGEHQAHRDGDVLVISADALPDLDEHFVFAFSGRGKRTVRGRSFDSTRDRDRSLRIRVNPEIPLDTEIDAGSIAVHDVTSPIRVRVSAGSAKLTGIASPIDAQISAGSLVAQGRLDHGQSVIVCDAGSVKVDLDAGSSVKVTARTSLGKVVLPGNPDEIRASLAGLGGLGASDEQTATVGGGDGSLDITANLGKVVVRLDDGRTSTTSWASRDR